MSTILPFYDSKGLDLISSDYSQDDSYQSSLENVIMAGSTEDPQLKKRPGFQVKAVSPEGFNLVEFTRLNSTTYVEEKELLAVGDNLYRLQESSVQISYSGPASSAHLKLCYDKDESGLVMVLAVDSVTATIFLGKGFDEASTMTLAGLKTLAEGVSGITMTITGSTSLPAAFLDVLPEHDLLSGSATLKAYSFSAVPFPANPNDVNFLRPFFDTAILNQDQESFEPPSSTPLNNVLYIAGGYSGKLMKYDGQKIYEAGLPKTNRPIIDVRVSGSLPAGTYKYCARLVHVDAAGNRIEGPISDIESITVAASSAIRLKDYLLSGSGINISSAVVSGNQTGALINVDPGHSIIAGDVCYFYNGDPAVATWSTATARSVTATTILFDRYVEVLNGSPITNNLRVQIYRTKAGQNTFYLNREIPLSFSEFSNLIDQVTDATLGAQPDLAFPEFDYDQPPPCRYVATFKGSLVVAGIPNFFINRKGSFLGGSPSVVDGYADLSPNDVWFGDVENIEGFPSDGSFTVSVASDLGDKISGLKQNGNSLIVLKEKSIHRIAGEPTDLQVQTEVLSSEVGCLSHASIQQINNQLIFLSNRGVASLVETQMPSAQLGYRVKPLLDDRNLNFKKATSVLWPSKQLYILHIPSLGGDGLDSFTYSFPGTGDGLPGYSAQVERIHASQKSRIFVLDYLRGAWFEWRKINALGGLAVLNDELWFMERRFSTYSSSVKTNVMRLLSNNHITDYVDHDQGIPMKVKTAWYAPGGKSQPKQFLRLRVAASNDLANNSPLLRVSQEVNFIGDVIRAETELDLSPDGTLEEIVAQTKLADGKFRSSRFVMENDAVLECPIIEGWELEIDGQYVGELKT
jgi:hypothetical protein